MLGCNQSLIHQIDTKPTMKFVSSLLLTIASLGVVASEVTA
jgi:hypothetical protein